MIKPITNILLIASIIIGFISCSEDNAKPDLRAKVDYNTLTATSSYSQTFVDEQGNTTVNLSDSYKLFKMFQALNYYSSSSVTANTHIDGARLKSMFANTGSPFTNISTTTVNVVGAELNSAPFSIKATAASSMSTEQVAAVRATFDSYFDKLDLASNSVNSTATSGQAGKLGSYLVDAKGLEYVQVIQKSLIGALQVDYIGNRLLNDRLEAENHQVVADKNYSELEHNWDLAYGMLTLNPIYLEGATDANRNTVEFALGSYIWEYNKTNYAKIYPAFLKGRAAIVNNDQAELKAQATFIRTQFEKTIAMAALGYLDKWKTSTTDAARAHAIGEGLGFVYSLRFATIHGADATFSDNIINGLIGSGNGFWDLTAGKITTASDAIKAKFAL